MGGGKKRGDNFAQMIEVACRYDKPVRIGVNWGSLDHELMARMMDENSQRSQPWDARAVMRQALVVSAISNARRAEARSEEHTSELQSLMRTTYAVLCLNKNTHTKRSSHHD